MGAKNDAVVQDVVAKHGTGAVRAMGDAAVENVECFPTGSLALDIALGVGGWPRGVLVELYGSAPEKALLAMHAVAGVQQNKGVAAWIDGAHDLDVQRAQLVGVSMPKLLVSQPDTVGQALDIAEMLARSGAVDLIVVDSLVSWEMAPETDFATACREIGKSLRALAAICSRTRTTIVFVTRPKTHRELREVFSEPTWAPGSNAIKFYASVRVDVGGIFSPTSAEYLPHVKAKVSKNKFAAPFREALLLWRANGIDELGELVELGEHHGLLKRVDGVLETALGPGEQGLALGRTNDRCRDTLISLGAVRDDLRVAIKRAAGLLPGVPRG